MESSKETEEETPARLPRRRILRLLSLIGAGTATGCWLARDRANREQLVESIEWLRGRVDHTLRRQANEASPFATWSREIPSDPVAFGYRQFLISCKLRHLSSDEVVRAHDRRRNGVANRLPDPALWNNLAPTLEIADELCEALGVGIRRVNSVYRSPAYNAQCPGAASRSQHIFNRALDLSFQCPPREAFEKAKDLRRRGKFEGGLGLYSTFVHIDTRGQRATWGG